MWSSAPLVLRLAGLNDTLVACGFIPTCSRYGNLTGSWHGKLPEAIFWHVDAGSHPHTQGLDREVPYHLQTKALCAVKGVTDTVPSRGRRWWATTRCPCCYSSSPRRWTGGGCRASCRSSWRSRTRSAMTACPGVDERRKTTTRNLLQCPDQNTALMWTHHFSVMWPQCDLNANWSHINVYCGTELNDHKDKHPSEDGVINNTDH